MIKKIFIKLIKLYQRIPGPWHASCKFYPTCSNFAIEALEKYGTIRGILLIIARILRCNPWAKGGYYYPVPNKFTLKRIDCNVNKTEEKMRF